MSTTSMTKNITQAAPEQATLSTSLTFLLAAGTGLTVAALYYSQPTLGVLAGDLHATARNVGWIPTLTQLGYAIGLLVLAPLGDRYDRRNIIVIKALILSAALLLTGFAPTLGVLLAASLAVGLFATVAQDIVPAAATLAPAAHRGKAVGTVMTGLLMGILLSRVVSGFVAEHFGWRTVFMAAAVSVLLLAGVMAKGLPHFAPTTTQSYPALLQSLATLWRAHRKLRLAALAQGLLALGFSAFWSTLAVMLHDAPFHLGSAVAGSFGLAGAVGALAAPFAGRLADRRGAEWVTRIAATITVVSFGAMLFMPLLSTGAQLALLALATVGFDLGVQASLISHQSIIYGIAPEARSRLNALLMTSVFVGMAAGGFLGAQALAGWGWMGVVGVAMVASGGALLVRIRAAAARD
ncbi:MFS transporter [Herbaspirillum sp. SJZ107]|uniref:MFS transporter n=1 Tax=Herbaspirillum sp. SJZ107 TaxID=2572881 RepID=UPI001153F357|nr:MFS transporter [Herbaspirillum sp. SJZ107]TQK02561.1 putative MFS family arabinose efflux permease [Herbaspirillum sp. SJZ107]